MDTKELENMTADTGAGAVGAKTWFKVIRGFAGKFGTELHINMTQANAAIAAGAHKYVNKSGDTILTVKPKFWPKKEETIGEEQFKQAVDVVDTKDFLTDEVPF